MNLRKHYYMDEAADAGAGGGSGGSGKEDELNVDITAASASLAADLGLGDEEPSKGSAATPSPTGGDKTTKVETPSPETLKPKLDDKGQPVVTTPPVRGRPKAWAEKMDAHWGKLPPEVQDYVEQRENEVATGFQQNGEHVTYAKALRDVLQPYQPLLDAQGVKSHADAVRFLMNAHFQLSQGETPKRLEFFARVAKSYGLDLAEVAKVATAEQPFATDAEKQLAARVANMENAMTAEQRGRLEKLRETTENEVATFATDPAHAYFNEVGDHIALLLRDPKISLKDAYEQAVWANPVTRAKEQARLQKESEAQLRKDATEAALKAEKARGTKVAGAESERASPDFVGSMDDTLRETLKDIKSRT